MSFVLLLNRGVIGLYGSKVKDFLNSITTNDILKLNSENPLYCLMLDSRGRYAYDFFVIEGTNEILLDCNIDDINSLISTLKIYRLNLKIKIKDLTEYCKVGVFTANITHAVNSKYEFSDPRCKKLGIRKIFVDSQKYLQFPASDNSMYEKLRIENVVPDSSKDMIRGESFPLHYRIDKLNGIDFNKGCYLGQEVVARMYRASVKKNLYLVRSISNSQLPYRKIITMNNVEEIGTSLSSCCELGLCLLNIEKVNYGMENNCRFYVDGDHEIAIVSQ